VFGDRFTAGTKAHPITEIYSDGAVGVGVGEADGSGVGDSPGVEKFGLSGLLLDNGLGVGTRMNWG
jgi:hypothetical protein